MKETAIYIFPQSILIKKKNMLNFLNLNLPLKKKAWKTIKQLESLAAVNWEECLYNKA